MRWFRWAGIVVDNVLHHHKKKSPGSTGLLSTKPRISRRLGVERFTFAAGALLRCSVSLLASNGRFL
jgi:hypothetical protein